jgi:hypothetical protein
MKWWKGEGCVPVETIALCVLLLVLAESAPVIEKARHSMRQASGLLLFAFSSI